MIRKHKALAYAEVDKEGKVNWVKDQEERAPFFTLEDIVIDQNWASVDMSESDDDEEETSGPATRSHTASSPKTKSPPSNSGISAEPPKKKARTGKKRSRSAPKRLKD